MNASHEPQLSQARPAPPRQRAMPNVALVGREGQLERKKVVLPTHLHLIVEDRQYHLVETADSEKQRNVLVPKYQLEAVERTVHRSEKAGKRHNIR